MDVMNFGGAIFAFHHQVGYNSNNDNNNKNNTTNNANTNLPSASTYPLIREQDQQKQQE